MLRRYLAYLQTRGFARPTIARNAAAVRAYVRFLRRTAVFTRDVAVDLRTPKGRKTLPRVPRATTRPRCSRRLRRTASTPAADTPTESRSTRSRARRDLAVLELLYGAGLRVSECCGLDVGEVDLRRRTVTVLGKGSKVRRLPLGDPAGDAVRTTSVMPRSALVVEPTDALFVNLGGTGSRRVTHAGSWSGSRYLTAAHCIRTHFGMHLPLISSKEVPI